LLIILAALLVAFVVGCTVKPVGFTPTNEAVVVSRTQPEPTAPPDAPTKLGRYVNAISAALDSRPRAALTRIEGTARQLLALRGYLRSEGGLGARWSWTEEEIRQFEKSAEYRGALDEVEKVRRKFAESNPGYELYVNTQVRTLEKQIRFWNETRSVQVAGDGLLAAALRELDNPAYTDPPTPASINRFRQFLKSARLEVAPTVATPGLSQHGQLRAFDFQVQRGQQLVAGTDSASVVPVWEGQGWEKKLNAAVFAVSRKFKGPLVSPREPWHYDYVP
jgi:hypothetical protein